jgi:hypothetical protein
MKKLLSLCASILISTFAFSQALNPVTWQASYQAISKTEGEILITAHIEKDWHTYSQRETTDGPIPTSFSFTPSGKYQLLGKTEESEAHEEYVPAFEAKIFVFTGKAEFRQKIKHSGTAAFDLPFRLEFMSCNDMMCLPPKTIDLFVKVQ